jgi:hypothetical protein
MVIGHSIIIDGHKTSVSLEEVFSLPTSSATHRFMISVALERVAHGLNGDGDSATNAAELTFHEVPCGGW